MTPLEDERDRALNLGVPRAPLSVAPLMVQAFMSVCICPSFIPAAPALSSLSLHTGVLEPLPLG